MYRKPRFLKLLHEIRQEMARGCDYDIDRFIQGLQNEIINLTPEIDRVSVGPGVKSRPRHSKRTRKEF